MKITYTDNQKQVKLAESELSYLLANLSEAVVKNLLNSPPVHLDKKTLLVLDRRGNLSLTLVSNQKMQHLNKIWRNKPKTTDVLSFSLVVDDPDGFQLMLSAPELPIELGEIVISAPKAEAQALEHGHSLKRELSFLFVHGLLHVLGFDHMTKGEEKEMFGRQAEVLESLGILR